MPAVELAVALTVIATRAIVADLIKGSGMSNDAWAAVGSDIAGAVMTSALRPDGGAQLAKKVDLLSRQIKQVGQQVEDLPVREFDIRMAAGRRHMRDLPAHWRTRQDRRQLIHDARNEFVSAVALAETMGDVRRQALAEVAIAACWLWVPSLRDVKNTAGHVRRALENELLFGSTWPVEEYADIVKLCRAYGEQPKATGTPIVPSPSRAPTPGARLAVHAKRAKWVECAGIRLRLEDLPVESNKVAKPATGAKPVIAPMGYLSDTAIKKFRDQGVTFAPATWLTGTPTAAGVSVPSDEHVTVTVHNTRAEWVSVSATAHAIIIQLTKNNTLPSGNRVKPGAKVRLTLTRPRPTSTFTPAHRTFFVASTSRPVVAQSKPLFPSDPTVGFVFPER